MSRIETVLVIAIAWATVVGPAAAQYEDFGNSAAEEECVCMQQERGFGSSYSGGGSSGTGIFGGLQPQTWSGGSSDGPWGGGTSGGSSGNSPWSSPWSSGSSGGSGTSSGSSSGLGSLAQLAGLTGSSSGSAGSTPSFVQATSGSGVASGVSPAATVNVPPPPPPPQITVGENGEATSATPGGSGPETDNFTIDGEAAAGRVNIKY